MLKFLRLTYTKDKNHHQGYFSCGITVFFFLVIVSVAAGNEVQRRSRDDITFGFFAQSDVVSFGGDTLDIVANKQNFNSGINFPRDRLYVYGKKLDWFYCLEYDVHETEIRDAFLRYEKYQLFRITLGQYKIPYDFWFQTTHSNVNYLEQALPTNTFIPGFRIGLGVQYFPDPFTFAFNLFTIDSRNKIQNNQIKGHQPLAASTRITFAPVHKEKIAIHFAAAGIIQGTDSLNRFRFRTFPEAQTYHNHFLVDTDFIYQCKNYIGEEFETAVILGPFSIQGAYYNTHVNRTEAVNFNGFYITADYFLTGEHYIYDFKEGTIDGISSINHAFGAWQLAARYSNVDLEDENVQGGRERNVTLGLNWIVNSNLKFVLDYIFVNATPSDNGLNRHMNIFALRCQLSAESL